MVGFFHGSVPERVERGVCVCVCLCRFVSDACRFPMVRPHVLGEVEEGVGVSVRVFVCVGLGLRT